MSEDTGAIIAAFAADNAKKPPKNPKASARQKYNRRKLWLAHALDQMDIAIDHLLAQDGTAYKRKEIDTLKGAIAAFRDTTNLSSPVLEPPSQEELDRFIDMLSNLKPWNPLSKEELATLYTSIGLAVPPDEDEASDWDATGGPSRSEPLSQAS